MTHHVRYEQWLPVAIEQVFLFFAHPGNLPRIMPPGTGTELIRLKLVPPPAVATEPATITDREPLAGAGSEIVTSFRIIPFLPLRAQWTALITEFEWNHHFADVQTKGPFKSFHHRHELFPETRNGVNGTVVRDLIDYEVGFGLLGELAHKIVHQPAAAADIRISPEGVGEAVGMGAGNVGTGQRPVPTCSVIATYLLGSTTTAVP